MWKTLATPLVIIAALATVWIYPPLRHFLLGQSENTIGVVYSKGIVLAHDDAAALHWYEAAARQGSVAGQFNLAYALQLGLGAPANPSEAARWYESAAARGMAEAANNLGLMYANPRRGPPDFVLARVWLKRALPLADRDLAATITANLKAMEKDMRPEELAQSDQQIAPAETDRRSP